MKADPAAVKNTGDKLLQVSAKNSTAWNVALTMVDYRSNLNDASVPPRDSFYPFGPANAPCCKPVPGIEETYYNFPVITGKERPQFTTSMKRVSIANSARVEKIGHPVPQSAHNGPESLLGHGGEIALDGYYLRNIVLDGMTVHYSGGPIILDNVIFNNCRFVFDNAPSGRQLGSRILSASAVTFHTPSA